MRRLLAVLLAELRLQRAGACCTRRWHEQRERDARICMMEQER